MYWSKTHEIKSKYKFNLYFTFEIINIYNRSCRKFFFPFLSLTHFFITATYKRFSIGNAQARKQYARTKTCFPFKIKNQIILLELEGILKNNLKVVQPRFKDITCVPYCHNVNWMMKYEGYPNFDPFRRYFDKNYWERPSI